MVLVHPEAAAQFIATCLTCPLVRQKVLLAGYTAIAFWRKHHAGKLRDLLNRPLMTIALHLAVNVLHVLLLSFPLRLS
jgi:hypothetical protein